MIIGHWPDGAKVSPLVLSFPLSCNGRLYSANAEEERAAVRSPSRPTTKASQGYLANAAFATLAPDSWSDELLIRRLLRAENGAAFRSDGILARYRREAFVARLTDTGPGVISNPVCNFAQITPSTSVLQLSVHFSRVKNPV